MKSDESTSPLLFIAERIKPRKHLFKNATFLSGQHRCPEHRSPGCSIVPNGGRTEGRKVGDVPASSECLDQENTCVQSTALDINGVSLVAEFDRLRGDDLEIRVHPTFVTIRKKLKRFLR